MDPAEYLQAAKYARSRGDDKRFRSLCESILKEHPKAPEASVARQLLDDDPIPTDTQQEATQEEEVGKISAKTKISRTLSIALFVIAGLAAVYLLSFFGDLSDSSEKVSSTLNSVAKSEPFWGGLGAVFGGIGWFFVLIAAFIIAGPVAIIIMAIFGTGLLASSASDNPEKRGTAAKVARGCGITALWVSGLLCVAILSLISGIG